MSVTKDTREKIAIYSENCLLCKHFVSSKKKAWSVCHYTKGNQDCPASEVQLVVVGKAYRMARQVLSARDGRDAEAEAKLLAIVAKETEAFQERFYFALENPRSENKQ